MLRWLATGANGTIKARSTSGHYPRTLTREGLSRCYGGKSAAIALALATFVACAS